MTTPDYFSSFIASLFENFIAPCLVGTASFFFFKLRDYLKNKHNSFSIHITSEKNDKIQELLTEIRVTFNANRTYLVMFHNGDKYIDGSEILKMSRINECVDASTNFQAQYFQNLKISLLPEEMKLVKNHEPTIVAVNDLEDGKFKRLLIAGGVKTIARCPIRNGENIIGFIGADWIDSDKKPINIDKFEIYSGTMEQILSSFR